jgi:hypothetical protein
MLCIYISIRLLSLRIYPVSIVRFGDSGDTQAFTSTSLQKTEKMPRIPIIKKFRTAFPRGMDDVNAMTKEACITGHRPVFETDIVWRLTSDRHFGPIPSIPPVDIPWENKKSMAVFRGALTGKGRDGFTALSSTNKSEVEKCRHMHRCRLVYTTANSSIVDARLVPLAKQVVTDTIGGVLIYGDRLNFEQMLKFKAIIMLEGNDVSSGFKWAMYSNSVVMTQVPTKSSWAMEDVLEPWVHYIPLNQDLADVEEKMQWVIDNDEKARMIAKRGSLWIRDLLYHPDSAKDEEAVFDEIIRRYRAHFVEAADLVVD